jgi:hypothetical protein
LLLFDIISSITSLLNGMRKQPSEILYDWDFQPELLQLIKVRHPNINIIKHSKSQLMLQESDLFFKVLQRWVDRNNNNWLYGVHVIQAVTNTLPF